jgi:hypothetical protein
MNPPYSSDREPSQRKQKWVDVINENYTRTPVLTYPAREPNQSSNDQQQQQPYQIRRYEVAAAVPGMDHGARILVGYVVVLKVNS